MKPRLLLNLAMFAIVILLGYFAFGTDEDTALHQISTLKIKDIDSIEIAHRDRYIVLKKQDDRWRMTRPINIEANDFRIGTLLKVLKTTSHASYDITEVNLASLKLDRPVTTLRLNDTLFEFGSSNPINRLRYLKVGNRVHMIDDNLYPLVSSQIGTLVALNVLPDDAVISRLDLPELSLKKDGARWRSSPEDAELSTDDINQLVENWKTSQAFGVHNYLERKQLGNITIDYTVDNITTQAHFVITDTDPWLIIARPELDIEYHFDTGMYDKLLRPGNTPPDDIEAELLQE